MVHNSARMLVDGNLLILGNIEPRELAIIDISDIRNPKQVSRVSHKGIVNDMRISGKYLFMALEYRSVAVYDLGDIASPRFLTEYIVPDECHELEVIDQQIFVADEDGLLILTFE